jgi:thiamine kinase-like enzyme
MFLTPNNVAVYLLHGGLVSPASVVNDGFFLVEVGRRNRNFKIYRGGQRGLFIKQIKSTEPQAIATLQREAAFYRRLGDGRIDEATRRLIPRLVHYDPSRCILIVDLVAGAQSLAEYHAQDIQRLHTTSRQLATELASLHSQLAVLFSPAEKSLFPLQLPWPLTLDQGGHHAIRQLGAVGIQLSSALERMPGFENRLASLRSLWQWETVIHGDMKWENALLKSSADSPAQFHVVDWELVDFGDSAWDVASLLKEHLIHALFALFNGGSMPGSQPAADRQAAVTACATSAREFFQQYVSARQIHSAFLPTYAGRLIRFTAARLVTAVLEYLYFAPAMMQMTDLILQTAQSFLEQPQQAAWNVLGTAAI